MLRENISFEDRYTVDRGRIILSGIQALVRLPLLQAQRDRAAGLDTSGELSPAKVARALAKVLPPAASGEGLDRYLPMLPGRRRLPIPRTCSPTSVTTPGSTRVFSPSGPRWRRR